MLILIIFVYKVGFSIADYFYPGTSQRFHLSVQQHINNYKTYLGYSKSSAPDPLPNSSDTTSSTSTITTSTITTFSEEDIKPLTGVDLIEDEYINLDNETSKEDGIKKSKKSS